MNKRSENVKTATRINGKTEGRGTGEMRLYKLDPPMEGDEYTGLIEYVIVSATVAMFSGAETYIFPADADGEITDWGELDGSFRGALDHEQALHNAGYSVAEGERPGVKSAVASAVWLEGQKP